MDLVRIRFQGSDIPQLVVAKPVSASRRALSVTWRLTYFLGVAKV
jgi:hypothetical protein